MFSFRKLSIDGKLKLLVAAAAGIAVMLACAAFVFNDVRTIRRSMVAQLSALADVLGANSTAAIEFDDAGAATEILASLKLQHPVELACLYDESGKMFALYRRPDVTDASPLLSPPVGTQFTDSGHIDVTQPVVRDGKQLGMIHVHAGMNELRAQVMQQVGIGLLVTGISLATAFIFSVRLQRAISQPILNLAETAQRISQARDYSIRVQADSSDELGVLYEQFNDMLTHIQQGERALQEANDHLEQKVAERTSRLSEAVEGLNREVAERTRAESELKDVHSQLMGAARRAGMAEIATGVLHNIGNVLNSINVSASLAADRLRGARIEQLQRVVQMIEERRDDLGAFLGSDPKGSQIPGFLAMLAAHLVEEKAEIIKELESLTSNIDHVKTIVATQQSYAGVSGVTEEFEVSSALDDALKLNSAAFDRHRIEIVREYQDLPKVRLDRQKLLQILVNLVKNAKDALVMSETADRRLTFRTCVTPENRLQIEVSDNGIGIPAEHLTRIFSHGFTTKRDGHGFGLHSCANAAKEMEGSLGVESDGPGLGAAFTLDLPFRCKYEPCEEPARAGR
jgi:two-component system, NtrC family, sensor kinase